MIKMKEPEPGSVDIRNARMMCDSLYTRMEKEIARLKRIASKRQGDEQKFVIDLIKRLEQEKGDYRRTGTSPWG
jgi:hypothetical protein